MKAPVGNTCGQINQCIAWLRTAKEYINLSVELSESDKLTGYLGEALKYCDIEKELEELRDANSKLREWGYELSDELEKLKSC